MHTSHYPVWNTKYVRLPSHDPFNCSRIALLLVVLVNMVIDVVYSAMGIFLNSRELKKGQWESQEFVIS